MAFGQRDSVQIMRMSVTATRVTRVDVPNTLIISGLVSKEEDSVHLSLVAETESVAHAVASDSPIPTVAQKESNSSLSDIFK